MPNQNIIIVTGNTQLDPVRGSLLLNFDELVDNLGLDSLIIYVNNELRKIRFTDTENLFTTNLNLNDVVTIDLIPGIQIGQQISVTRRDYTTDDQNGDNGIRDTFITSTSGTTSNVTVTFTATTTSDAYSFRYIVDATTFNPAPTPTPIPVFNYGNIRFSPSGSGGVCDTLESYDVQVNTINNLLTLCTIITGSIVSSGVAPNGYFYASEGFRPTCQTTTPFNSNILFQRSGSSDWGIRVTPINEYPTCSITPDPLQMEYYYEYTSSANLDRIGSWQNNLKVYYKNIQQFGTSYLDFAVCLITGSAITGTIPQGSFPPSLIATGSNLLVGSTQGYLGNDSELILYRGASSLNGTFVIRESSEIDLTINGSLYSSTTITSPATFSNITDTVTFPIVASIIEPGDIIRAYWKDVFIGTPTPTPTATPTPTPTATPTPTPTATPTPTPTPTPPTPTPTATPTPTPTTVPVNILFRYSGAVGTTGISKQVSNIQFDFLSSTYNHSDVNWTNSVSNTEDLGYFNISGTSNLVVRRRICKVSGAQNIDERSASIYVNGGLVAFGNVTTNVTPATCPSTTLHTFNVGNVTVNPGDTLLVVWNDLMT
jgi:hypothetical protein